MAKIAVLIENSFEDIEYTRPAQEFARAGHQLVHVGLKQGSTVKGKQEGTPVTIDLAVESARVDDFDALLIPGGYSPDRLRGYESPVSFTRKFVESGKPVFAICHAPQLLISADVLRGRKVTGWKSIVRDIENAGATYLDQEVVVDGNLISSRGPSDIPAFVEACLGKLKKPE